MEEEEESTNIHILCGKASDSIIKNSLIRKSLDNVTVVILFFANFKNYFKIRRNKFGISKLENDNNSHEKNNNKSIPEDHNINKCNNNNLHSNNNLVEGSIEKIKSVAQKQINQQSGKNFRNHYFFTQIESENVGMEDKENWSKTILGGGISQKKIHLKFPN